MKSAEKIARRLIAEKLTKEWLAGVRRGWLQLMKPAISDYDDVMKAHDKLDQFVERLQEQIQYIRRGGAKRLLDDKYEPKLEAAFKKVFEAIDESRGKARHWKEYIDGTATSLQWGEDRTKDALLMLDLYKRDFAEASNTAVETRGHKWKTVDLTDLLDEVFKLLRSDAVAIQKHDEANPDDPFIERPEVLREFHIGDMKFILVLGPEDKPSYATGYAKLLSTTYAIVQAKKIKHLWYGLCFLTPSCEKLDEQTLQDYERQGYDRKYLECRAGWYRYRNDVIALTSYPAPGAFIYGLLHELGHRHWFKFMSSSQRARYADWVESKAVDAVSDYGKSNPEEAFAEAFAHYTTGKGMTRDQMESFREVAFGRTASKVALRSLNGGYLNIGDLILYGKFKNARGRITGFGKNDKGDPTVLIQPVDKDGNAKKGQPKELVMLKVRKIQPSKKEACMSIEQRVVARYVAASLGLGQTWENGKVRIHRYANFYKVWDLTNAGKRGKKVRVMSIIPNVAHEREWMETQGKFINTYGTYEGIKSFYEDILHDFPGEILIEENAERGIDVLPGGTEEIDLRWSVGESKMELTATPLEMRVKSSVPLKSQQTGKPFGYQDTLYWADKKADAKRFYAWLSGGGRKLVTRMGILELRKLWNDIGVRYDYH